MKICSFSKSLRLIIRFTKMTYAEEVFFTGEVDLSADARQVFVNSTFRRCGDCDMWWNYCRDEKVCWRQLRADNEAKKFHPDPENDSSDFLPLSLNGRGH